MKIVAQALAAVALLTPTTALSTPPIETEGRPPIETPEGLLTPFWAQEMIGADLVKEELRGLALPRVPVSVYDIGFEKEHLHLTSDIHVDLAMNGRRRVIGHHGNNVAHLLHSPGMTSVSEIVDFVQLRSVSPGALYFGAFRDIERIPVRPRIISNSMGWTAPSILNVVRAADEMGIIWVHAVGNSHPEVPAEHEQQGPVISVGSASHLALQTVSSQEHAGLDLLAPSDEYLSSFDGRGEPSLFGLTSGATPLVSGTIANALAILPSLTRADIEALLKTTAFPTLHQQFSPINRAGLLNAYRMIQAVRSIRDRCGDDRSCIAQASRLPLRSLRTPRPSVPSRLLGACENSTAVTHEELAMLRKSFLMEPENTPVARALSCLYRTWGFVANALYIENIHHIIHSPNELMETIRRDAALAVRRGWRNSPYLRDLEILDHRFEAALREAIESNTGLGAFNARRLLERYQRIHARP